jgi:hypothetical protein
MPRRLPESLGRKEHALARPLPECEEEPSSLHIFRELKAIWYGDVTALEKFVDTYSLYTIKHGVKGDELENVLVANRRRSNPVRRQHASEWPEKPGSILGAKQPLSASGTSFRSHVLSRRKGLQSSILSSFRS